MSEVLKRPAAKQDVIEQADYLAQDSLEAAYEFLVATEETFLQLSRFPKIGKKKMRSKAFTSVRQFPVKGFEQHLIFYRPIKGGIEILRVLHSARDFEQIL
ncbi:MAG: type II toxin-antitoxin system RelE/ParE family toxin [Acidobacteria bacterium]|nr:type II toxin-antitoxin system RelE/ParE family toxin [Acidobacteriota bacterium]